MLTADRITVAPPGAAEAVLENFSITVAGGERVALTGPIGCGKSTLALALAGLIPVRSGQVRLDGLPLDLRAPSRRRVAAVLQEPNSQLMQGTVRDEVEFAVRNLGLDDPAGRAAEWLDRMNLTPLAGRNPQHLSAGQQQILLMAAALATDPGALVVDEGTAHLDPASRERVLVEVERLTALGLAVLWVTQIEEETRAADRLVRIGGTVPCPPPSPAAARPAGRVAARIRVTPSMREDGPRILVQESREFAVPESGILCLTGRNGTGKTILLEALAGLRSHDQVQVVGGTLPGPAIVAGQFPELGISEERVAAEVSWSAARRGLSAPLALSRACETLERLGMGRDLVKRRTWELSSGQKRIIHVVSAIITPSSFVVLDEPTCGLDTITSERLAELVVEQSRSTPFLVATQDPSWLRSLPSAHFALGLSGPCECAKYRQKNGLTQACNQPSLSFAG